MRLMPCLLAMLLLLAAPALASDPPSCRNVRLAQNNWTDVDATTAVAAALLRALGYTPRVITEAVPDIFQAMRKKQVEAFLGVWLPTMATDLQPFLDDHSIVALNTNLTGAKYGLAVPDFMTELGLRDIRDIAKFGSQLNHHILAIEPGNDGNLHLQDLIDRNVYGLGTFQLEQTSTAAMLAEVEKAARVRQPVVFLAWAPHWMNRDIKLTYLTGGDAVFGPNTGAATVNTHVAAGWPEQCPNAARLLKNLVFSQDAVDDLMATIRLQHRTPDRAATDWLRANPIVLAGWLDGVTAYDGTTAAPLVRERVGIRG